MRTPSPLIATLFLAAVVGCSSSSDTPTSTPDAAVDAPAQTPDAASDSPVTPLTTQLELRDTLRSLFMDRATWVRLYLIDAVAKSPDLPSSTQRLVQNQTDIGSAIVPFYGAPASAQLTTLLQDGVKDAAATVTAALANDTAGFNMAKATWYANADQVATFLASANPNWKAADLQAALHGCIDDAIAEASARMAGNWTADTAAADTTMKQALAVADALSDGIGKQFPDKVGPTAMTSNAQALHLGMRALFQDRSAWVHEYLVDAIGKQPSAGAAAQRLMQNGSDIGDAVAAFYGAPAGAQLTKLLDQAVTDAAATVTAALANDMVAFNTSKTAWYADADQLATFLAGANPNWKQGDLQAALHTCIDDALADATAQMKSDWATDVTSADTLRGQARGVADALSVGVIAQFKP